MPTKKLNNQEEPEAEVQVGTTESEAEAVPEEVPDAPEYHTVLVAPPHNPQMDWAGPPYPDAAKPSSHANDAWAGPNPEPPPRPAPPPVLPKSGELYTVGKWGRHDNYECKLCPYSTLEHENILAHIVERHSGIASKVQKKTHS